MSQTTQSSIVIDADAADVMTVIADVPSYPQWAGEVTGAEVVEAGPDRGRPRQARLVIDAGPLRDVQVHTYEWGGDRRVHWALASSRLLSALDGEYDLTPLGGTGTLVTYRLAVTTRVPMLGLVKRQAEKVIIDRALAGLKARVESLHRTH